MTGNIKYFRMVLSALVVSISTVVYAEKLTIQQVTNNIIQYYPDIRIATIEIQKSRQEINKVKSQLGWNQQSSVGLSRDVSIISSPVDQITGNLSYQRQYESGDSVSFTGYYQYSDSSSSFSPAIPNPSNTVRMDIQYRIPLEQGRDNPDYYNQQVIANESSLITEQSQHNLVNSISLQAIDLYFDYANSLMRIEDVNKAIKRSRRLLKFIQDNKSLGLSAEEDVLRVEAQLQKQYASRDNLTIVAEIQRLELNRLMGKPADYQFTPEIKITSVKEDREILMRQAYDNSPSLNIARSNINISRSNTNIKLNSKRSTLDLIFSGGVYYNSGDTISGSIDNEELLGGVFLEYKFNHDQSGFDAELYQAKAQEALAKEELLKIENDLSYDLDKLLTQISAGEKSLKSNYKYYKAEEKKYKSAYQRYKVGRENINDLIDYENSVQTSFLSYKTQEIELARANSKLLLLIGELWDESLLPKNIIMGYQ